MPAAAVGEKTPLVAGTSSTPAALGHAAGVAARNALTSTTSYSAGTNVEDEPVVGIEDDAFDPIRPLPTKRHLEVVIVSQAKVSLENKLPCLQDLT
ncbi:hypothetical protein HK102_013514 [Quaeritorhiza haematococci]|nr:hypothetical protein HK102_013514 [Quaeritorhiza haematococci]